MEVVHFWFWLPAVIQLLINAKLSRINAKLSRNLSYIYICMQKGDVSHISVAFFVKKQSWYAEFVCLVLKIKYKQLWLYQNRKPKLNLYLKTMKIVVGFLLGGGCSLLLITYLDSLGISQYYKTLGPRATSLISPSNS